MSYVPSIKQEVDPMDEGMPASMMGPPSFLMEAAPDSAFDPSMLREQLAKQIRSGVVGQSPTPRPNRTNTVLKLKDRFRRKKFQEAMANPMGLGPAQMAALTMVPGMGQTSADTSQLYRQG